MAENLYNLDIYYIIEISWILYSIYVIPKDQDRFVFYVNNYINWDQFNQLYNVYWFNKSI